MGRPRKDAARYDISEIGIREIINNRIEDLGVSKYSMVHNGGSGVALSTLFRYLNGEADSYGATIENVFRSLGLKIVPDSVPEWVKARRH